MEKIFWGWIYKITSPSGRVYIGQTNNIKRRHYDYETLRCSAQHRLLSSFKKYGFEKHKMETLWSGMTTRFLLSLKEMEFIEQFDATDQHNGLNVIRYTSSKRSSYNREYRNKNTQPKKPKKRALTQYEYDKVKSWNKVFDPDHRAKMVERLRSDEVRAKLRAARAKQVIKRGKDNPHSIPVDQLSLEGQFIKRWDCAKDIKRQLGLSSSKVAAVCKGNRITHGGFKFRYASRDIIQDHP